MGIGHDGWIYQGRQYHQWFGHGTKPRDDAETALGTLDERIHGLGHTLIASLPASKRYHSASRLDAVGHARLDRVLHAMVRNTHASKAAFAAHFFEAGPDASFVAPFRMAAQAVATAAVPSDMHKASDALASAAIAVGVDRWRGFVHGVDEHIADKGNILVVPVRDRGPVNPLFGGRASTSVEDNPEGRPHDKDAMMAVAIIAGVLLGIAVANMKMDGFEAVAGRFGLDLKKRADLQAASAYLYVKNATTAELRRFGADQTDREQAAEALLQAVRAKPDLLDDAVGGVPNGALDEVRQAIKAAVPDPVTENADEEGLKDAWRKAGWTNAQITAGLGNVRERKQYDATGAYVSKDKQLPSWIPAEIIKRLPTQFGIGRNGQKAGAWRWEDPKDQGNGIRIDPGDPSSQFPSQKVDHVILEPDRKRG